MALPPSRDLFGVPSSSIRRRSTAAWSAASRPRERRGDLPVDRRDRAAARRSRRTLRRRRAGRAPRPSRSRRRPARSPGRSAPPCQPHLRLDRRPAARIPDPPAAHRGDLRRSSLTTPAPRAQAARTPSSRSTGSREQTRARPGAPDPGPPPRSDTRPATCRRRARGTARAAAAPCAPRARRAAPRRRRRDSASASTSKQREEIARAPCGAHRHFSSRWFRQNARSNAGSPYQAHSASRNTGPRGPIRMFFGLTSPCTRARLVRRGGLDQGVQRVGAVGMRAARSRPDTARAGCRRRSDRSRTPRRSSRSSAVAAWIRTRRSPTARATSGSAWPSRSSAFHSRWSAGSRYAMTRTPAACVLAEQLRHRLGRDRRRTAHPGRLEGVALDRREPVLRDPELGQRALDADRPARQIDPPDVRRHAAGQAREAGRVSVVQQPEARQGFDDLRLGRRLACRFRPEHREEDAHTEPDASSGKLSGADGQRPCVSTPAYRC